LKFRRASDNNACADLLAGAQMKGGSHHCQSAAAAALQDAALLQRQQRQLINEQATNLADHLSSQ